MGNVLEAISRRLASISLLATPTKKNSETKLDEQSEDDEDDEMDALVALTSFQKVDTFDEWLQRKQK